MLTKRATENDNTDGLVGDEAMSYLPHKLRHRIQELGCYGSISGIKLPTNILSTHTAILTFISLPVTTLWLQLPSQF